MLVYVVAPTLVSALTAGPFKLGSLVTITHSLISPCVLLCIIYSVWGCLWKKKQPSADAQAYLLTEDNKVSHVILMALIASWLPSS